MSKRLYGYYSIINDLRLKDKEVLENIYEWMYQQSEALLCFTKKNNFCVMNKIELA